MTKFRRLWRKAHTIYDCCKLLCWLQFMLGCSAIRIKNHKFISDWKAVLYTLAAMSSNIGILLFTAYIKFQDPYLVEMDSLIKSIIYLELGMSLFMYVVTCSSMLLNSKLHVELYKCINDLDCILISEFRCNMHYEQLMKKHLIINCFFNLIDLAIIILAITRASELHDALVNMFAGLAYSFVTGGVHLNCYVQMNFAEILAIRFRLLQKLLLMTGKYNTQKEQQHNARHLQRLIELVQQYHDCVRRTNNIFSWSLQTAMLHDFTLVTSELYLIFGGLTSSGSDALIYFVLLGLVLPSYKMAIAPVYSENAIAEGDTCFKIIQDIDFQFAGNKKVREMVSISLMWRYENRVQFSCGSMTLNKEVITAVYLQIFNYILILIQFRMTQEMGNQIEEQKNTIQDWIGVDYV